MENTKFNISEVAKLLYDNGINTSERKKSYPKDNEKIDESIEIAVFNLGVCCVKKELFLRYSFTGNPTKFYEFFIKENEFDEWKEIILDFYYHSISEQKNPLSILKQKKEIEEALPW